MPKKKLDNYNWSRRKFTKAVISAKILLASGSLNLPLACIESKPDQKGGIISVSGQNTLKLAMDEIIPASKKMPAVSQVGGVDYILEIMGELPEIAPLFVKLIDEMEQRSTIEFLSDFSNLSGEKRVVVLGSIEMKHPDLFKVLLNFTYEAYYTNEKVYKLIGYESHPTGSSGPQMKAFDENLLEPVKKMSPRYIQI